jgi:hypothetical protein
MGSVWQWFLRSLSPQQVCWLCLLVTMGAGFYGITTFARESEVSQIRVELLQQRLLDLRIRQCGAIKAGESAAFFAGQIQQQSGKYRELTKSPPDLPACSEL